MVLALVLLVLSSSSLASDPEAEPVTAARISDFHRSVSNLDIRPEVFRPVGEEGIAFQDGPLTVQLRSGWMVPIVSGHSAARWETSLVQRQYRMRSREALPAPGERGDAQLVGFAWVGEGSFSASVDDRADALILANRMVDLGYPLEQLAPVARREAPLTGEVQSAVFLSISPQLLELFLSGSEEDEEEVDPLEVTVYSDKEGRVAARRAAKLFQARKGVYDDLELDVSGHLAWDRTAWAYGAGSEDGAFLLVDLHTDLRFGVASAGGGVFTSGDRWLALARDDTGLLDPRRRWQLVAMGRNDGGVAHRGRIGGTPFPAADPGVPFAAPAPLLRLEPELAETELTARPASARQVVEVEARSTLTFRAVGGPVQWAVLDFPRVEAEPGSWSLLQATLPDGTPVASGVIEPIGYSLWELPLLDPPPMACEDVLSLLRVRDPTNKSPRNRVRILLPEPVAEGETVQLHVHTRDRWPLVQRERCHFKRSGAPNSGLQRYLPQPANGWMGNPWRHRIEAAFPTRGNLGLVMGGGVEPLGDDGEWSRYLGEQVTHAQVWPEIAIGYWRHDHAEAGRSGFPSLRVRLDRNRDRELMTLPRETRRVANYLQGWLPALPAPHLEVFESPQRCLKPEVQAIEDALDPYRVEAPIGCGTFLRLAPEGVVRVERLVQFLRMVERVPEELQGVHAHDVAHQLWGHLARPAHVEDFWIAETLAESFACMYVGALHGPSACEARMERARRRFEDGVLGPGGSASLSMAYDDPGWGATTVGWDHRVWQYGPYVMLEMLRPRIGTEAFFLALDVLLRDHAYEPLTTERLRQHLEVASGEDLRDFFDFWVHQAVIPSLTLTWEQGEDGRVEGWITSDVPFGTFDVPVVLQTRDQVQEIWVDVVDGEGVFLSDPLPVEPKVRLDPDGRVLARERRVRRGR